MSDETWGSPQTDELASTLRMLECAYPDGLSQEEYLPLLYLLQSELSFRQLAKVMSRFVGKERKEFLNDAYQVASGSYQPNPEVLRRVRAELNECGYLEWLQERH